MRELRIVDGDQEKASHPREVAEETLQNLMQFSSYLEDLSERAAELVETDEFYMTFTKLIDGINTFTEAVTNVKKVLRIGMLQEVNLLEADLLSILKDLLSSQLSKQEQYTVELLRDHLPKNLRDWREDGIPVLVRSRDS